ncbi:hypothetical protein OA78_2312 [Latilactobacillus curvatus]|nr:hypothetical protein OA78_2312 [Latilactobacillus curvatus]
MPDESFAKESLFEALAAVKREYVFNAATLVLILILSSP